MWKIIVAAQKTYRDSGVLINNHSINILFQ